MIGTALLLSIIVGSGIMGERLAEGNKAVALLANSVSTGAGLFVLILLLGPVSGAHFNPVVTVVKVLRKETAVFEGCMFIFGQVLGAIAGVALAHLMFGMPIYSLSESHPRSGVGQYLSEYVATFGLVGVVLTGIRYGAVITALAVAVYITSAYWFTASTSFANPAVTIARSLTNTFSGIDPSRVLGFIVFQVLGALSANLFFKWLFGAKKKGSRT